MAEDLGFNGPIPFDLDTASSVFPTDELIDDPPATAQSAIGQRDVQATVLQMAMVAASVANEGVVMRPFVVSEEFDRDLNILDQTSPVELRRALSPATTAALDTMMQDVVVAGTGANAALPGTTVGGKTGTAQVPGDDPHAWFIGYGVREGRRVAVAVVVETGGDAGAAATGGADAAPIAAKVMEAWLATTN